ncbi:Uncharacterized protein C7orf57, partial [Fulmarus glacialis]
PPTFQIPGLTDLAEALHEVVSGCHRKWIKETNSAYVRLAKQGGRPDRQKHYIPVTRRSFPAAYAAPDCSNPPATDEPSSLCSLPEYMIHREFKADVHHGNSYKTRRGPFDFEMFSSGMLRTKKTQRKRSFSSLSFDITSVRLKSSSPSTYSLSDSGTFLMMKLTPLKPAQRKSEAVNFSKLISNGYGTDWFQQCTGWEKKIQETSENSEQSKEPSQSESALASNESKPPFQGCNK